MSRKNLNYQLKSNGNVPLDYKETPLKKVAELNDIPLSDRFLGMTVTVLDAGDGKPADYWYIGDNLYSAEWKKKTFGEEDGSNHVINGENPQTVDVTRTNDSGTKKGELIVATDNVKLGVEDAKKGYTHITLGHTYGKGKNALFYHKSTFSSYTDAEIATTYNIHLIKQLIGKKLRYNKCSGELIPSHSTLQNGFIRMGDFAYVGNKSRGVSMYQYLTSNPSFHDSILIYTNWFYFQLPDFFVFHSDSHIYFNKDSYDDWKAQYVNILVDNEIIIESPFHRFTSDDKGNNNRFCVDLDKCDIENGHYAFKVPEDVEGNTKWITENVPLKIFVRVKNQPFRNCIVLNRGGYIEKIQQPENKWVKVLRHNKKFTVKSNEDIWEPQSLDIVQDFSNTDKNHKNRVIELDDFCKMIANNEIQVWLYSGAKNSRSLESFWGLYGRGDYCWRQFAKNLDGAPKRHDWPVVDGYYQQKNGKTAFYHGVNDTEVMSRYGSEGHYRDGYDKALYRDKMFDAIYLRKLGTSPENDSYEYWFYSKESCNTAEGVEKYIRKIFTTETRKIPRDRFREFGVSGNLNGSFVSTIHYKRYLDFAVFRIMTVKTQRKKEKYYTENMGGIYRLTYNENNGGLSNRLTYLGPIPYFKNMK